MDLLEKKRKFVENQENVYENIKTSINIKEKTIKLDTINADLEKVSITSDTKSDSTAYYFENGLRKVHPYNFTYKTNAKERWVNRTMIDVFTIEFHDRTPAYYVQHFNK